MSTTKEYKDHILAQLNSLDNINCRPMMGGHLFYYNNVLFGVFIVMIIFLKKADSNKKYNLREKIPYDGSKKTMYLVEDIENKELLRDIVIDTCKDL